MPKLIIRVEKQIELIEETFNDMEFGGKLGKMQIKVFKAIYKSKLNGLYTIMKRKLKDWILNEGANYFEAVEEGQIEYLTERRLAFEKFMFGTEKELSKEKEYGKFKNDRVILKVLRYFKTKGATTKDKAIGRALSGVSVLNFFNRFGIGVTWRIIDEV